MDASQTHQSLKQKRYWETLTTRETHGYREVVLNRLLAEAFPTGCRTILEIGAGTDILIQRIGNTLGATELHCADYDASKVEEMQASHPSIHWRQLDALTIDSFQPAPDLILLMDMAHEVYSFHGRPNKDPQAKVSHSLGIASIKTMIGNLSAILAPGGAIAITDNVLCEENGNVIVRCRNAAARTAIELFFKDYQTKEIDGRFLDAQCFTIKARDLCILLTQYNKIKTKDWERWAIERMEIHQYLSLEEFRSLFKEFGLFLTAEVGTPEGAWQEWNEDFEVLEGLDALPPKRISLLARKPVNATPSLHA